MLEKYSIHHQREDCHFQKDPVTLIKHDKVNKIINNNNNHNKIYSMQFRKS